MCLCSILPVFLTFLKIADGVTIKNLGGSWTVADVAGLYNFKGTVPGGIYSDLMDNNIIGDIFSGYNDNNTRWVAKTNWTYSRQLIVKKDLHSNEVINLVFDGIDTFAEIYINNVLVGKTDNMFVQYIFDVRAALRVGKNSIRIKFLSPVEKAAKLYVLQKKKSYVVPPPCIPVEFQGECHANLIRKMQASFGWDWGPAFPSVGIWKPVYLEGYHQSLIRDVTFETENNSDSWQITANIYMSRPPSSDPITGSVTLSLHTILEIVENVYDVEIFPNEDGEYLSVVSFSIPKLYVNLWWPNGYGSADLYQINVTYDDGINGDLNTKTFKIGFRTISLVQDKAPNGRSFHFMVNNVAIFAKGTNSIPINILPEKGQDRDTVRFLLKSAKDVHMNMIRIWGGGVYESDHFYELADEMGILIWQDFMFACSMYPVNVEFLSSVKLEVRHQVRRLQHHPSIILWAGNNENEAALRQSWYGTIYNFELYKRDYITLYVDTIRVQTLANDPTRPFLTSSPTNGIATEEEDYVAYNPQSEFYGDVHYYNYMANPWMQSYFPVPRFSSEYGLQSLPTLSSWLAVADNSSDLHFNSRFMRHRQHHPMGNAEMNSLISMQIELPKKRHSAVSFKALIFYTQIIQAMGMKQQTEYYRLWRSKTDSVGRGLTMGALYWQLNDVWVAPSWSGIDFNNNWKMLHYFARKFFSPIIVTTSLSINRSLKVYAVSDLLTNSLNNFLTISVYKWNSIDSIHEETIPVDVLSSYSKQIYSTMIDQYLSKVGCGLVRAEYNCFIYLSLTDKDNNRIAPYNFVFPSPLKTSNIKTASVRIAAVAQLDDEGKLFEITVETNGIALFVWLESDNMRGIFSDNGFLLVTRTKTVDFTSKSATTVMELRKNLCVTHLKDPQYLQ